MNKLIYKYTYFKCTGDFEEWQRSHDVTIRHIFPDIMDIAIGILVIYTEVENTDEIPS